MRKLIVNPAMCKVWENKTYNAYARIEFSDDGRLSICGVIGPMSNGDCKGGAGQCEDEIRKGMPTSEWTPEMLSKFCDIWDKWHLNDMHAECEHQRNLGWLEQAKEHIKLYHYKLNDKAARRQKEAKDAAIKSLKDGNTFRPNGDQIMYANLEYFYNTYEKIDADSELEQYYVPYKSCLGDPTEEVKTRGWVNYGEGNGQSLKGILGKPCPICGYKYGHGWNKVEVPQDIIDWLFALPETKNKPAWC